MDVQGTEAAISNSINLPCGLTVRFRQGVRPSGNVISLEMQRAIRTNADFVLAVNDGREAGSPDPVVIVNQLGSWTNMAAHAVQMGLREIEIWQPARTDETLTDTRRYLFAPNEKIAAIPNYKCGYSSLKIVFAQLWGDEILKNKGAFNVDGIMGMSELPSEFVFSIVRDPVERFVSFYVDKFMRGPAHSNHALWRTPHEMLLGKDFGPDAILQLIEGTPTAFADLHWKPFATNLFHQGRALAHSVYDIDAAASLSKDLSARLNRNISLPHVNVTRHIDHTDIKAETLLSRDRLERSYAADFELHGKLKAVGGASSLVELDLSIAKVAAPQQSVA